MRGIGKMLNGKGQNPLGLDEPLHLTQEKQNKPWNPIRPRQWQFLKEPKNYDGPLCVSAENNKSQFVCRLVAAHHRAFSESVCCTFGGHNDDSSLNFVQAQQGACSWRFTTLGEASFHDHKTCECWEGKYGELQGGEIPVFR